MKRTSLAKDRCPIARSLDAIGDCWSLLIVRDAMRGTCRFSAFQKDLGVAKNILAVRLRTLVAEGILEEQPASDGSAYQEYVLTPKGRGLFPIMVALRQWGEEFSFKPDEEFAVLLDRKTSRPLRKLEIRAQDGRVLQQADTMVVPVA
ncbi:MAG: helix-turn-helix domain-containing protein [Pseudomonadota bacterium]